MTLKGQAEDTAMLTRHEQWEAKLHHSIETHKAEAVCLGRV